MSNRSYVYTVDTIPTKKKKAKPVRSLSEWAWDVPLAHKILVSASPKRCQSCIWTQEIGVAGEFEGGRDRLLQFLDALGKVKVKTPKVFAKAVATTKTVLAHKKYVGKFILIDAGEIYDMEGGGLVACAKAFIKDVGTITKKVDRAIAGKENRWLSTIGKKWDEELGIEWSDVLYFDFNAK